MSYYRDVYLKSEDWKNLRNFKIMERGGRCKICGFHSESNDVHHLVYKRLFDVTPRDLVVVCRRCHDKIHSLLRKYPKMKKLHPKRMWKTIRMHLDKAGITVPAQLGQSRFDSIPRSKTFQERFFDARLKLLELRLVSRRRMPFNTKMLDHISVFNDVFSKPQDFIETYLKITNQDPRLYVLVKRGST